MKAELKEQVNSLSNKELKELYFYVSQELERSNLAIELGLEKEE